MVHLQLLLVAGIFLCMIDQIASFQPSIKARPNLLSRQNPVQIADTSSVLPTTVPLPAIIPISAGSTSFVSISAAMAVMWSNVAVANAEVINVFQPTLDADAVQSTSFGAVYLLGAVIPYFVLNAFIAPKLGLSKEVPEDDQNSTTPPENKTPF